MVKIVCLDSQEEACSSPALICHCRSSMPSDICAALALISLIVFQQRENQLAHAQGNLGPFSVF